MMCLAKKSTTKNKDFPNLKVNTIDSIAISEVTDDTRMWKLGMPDSWIL